MNSLRYPIDKLLELLPEEPTVHSAMSHPFMKCTVIARSGVLRIRRE